MDAKLKVDRAIQNLILTQPFYGSLILLLDLVPTDDPSIRTMATDGVSCFYNPKGINNLTQDQVEADVCHEILHCAMGHMYRLRNRDPKKWNMAADYVINPIVRDSGLHLEPGSLFNKEYETMSAEAVYSILPDDEVKNTPDVDIHILPPPPNADGSEPSESELEAKNTEWKSAALQAAIYAKSRGTLPGSIEAMLDNILKPKFPWREILANFLLTKRPGRLDWSRRSRRSLASGMYLPSRKREPTGDLVIAVDTSGSVSDKELQAGYAEILGILHQINPSRCIIIQCDSHIREGGVAEYDLQTIPDDLSHVKIVGRGGTSFQPPFNYVEDNDIEPHAFIYFTDGEAPWPKEVDYPVLWALTQELPEKPPFGEYLWLDI